MDSSLTNKALANLLLIVSDEHRKDAMGCVGHPQAKTPNLDALAARGNQKKRIHELGGTEACLNAYEFNHTPAPNR